MNRSFYSIFFINFIIYYKILDHTFSLKLVLKIRDKVFKLRSETLILLCTFFDFTFVGCHYKKMLNVGISYRKNKSFQQFTIENLLLSIVFKSLNHCVNNVTVEICENMIILFHVQDITPTRSYFKIIIFIASNMVQRINCLPQFLIPFKNVHLHLLILIRS